MKKKIIKRTIIYMMGILLLSSCGSINMTDDCISTIESVRKVNNHYHYDVKTAEGLRYQTFFSFASNKLYSVGDTIIIVKR